MDLERRCTENFWYKVRMLVLKHGGNAVLFFSFSFFFLKVELRVARAIVNLAGRFEADIESSMPQYTPKMNDFGLPVFHFDKSKKELGMIVKGLFFLFFFSSSFSLSLSFVLIDK